MNFHSISPDGLACLMLLMLGITAAIYNQKKADAAKKAKCEQKLP